MTEIELLTARLLRLERRFRWMRRGVIVLCILIAAGSALGQLRQIQPIRPELPEFQAPRAATISELRSEHFVLVDSQGKERASLVADRAGSVFLVLFDAAAKTRATLSVSNDGPSLAFYDPSGQVRTILGSTNAVASHVNENGIAERAPTSSIVLFDKMGKLLWREP